MRLKLVLLISLISAMIGAGLSFIVGRAIDGYWARLVAPRFFSNVWIGVSLTFAPTILSALLASIFVYRRTARRRKTQAALTAILVLLLSVLVLYPISWLFPRPPVAY